MRNGKTLLRWMGVMVVVAVAAMGCVMTFSAVNPAEAAETLEATDSGAPSAMVLFPVTDKPGATEAGMRPAVFNHLIHEKKVTDCQTCHHTGDQVSCTSCHTVEGKKEGNFVTLDRAMHAVDIAPRAKDTPSSCVSCHTENLKRRECAGCHSLMPQPKRGAAYCGTCHDVSKSMTAEQLAQGVRGKLSAEENEKLATETVLARSTAKPMSSNDIPYTVKIDGLSDEFEGNTFTHARHYNSLLKRIGDDKLAATFHNDPKKLCATCHHNSPLSATPPKCVSCHSPTISATQTERPALKAAYHLQCMTCHDNMKVARPQNTSCNTCHKARAK